MTLMLINLLLVLIVVTVYENTSKFQCVWEIQCENIVLIIYFQTNFFIFGFVSINSISVRWNENKFKTIYMEHNHIKPVKAELLWLKLGEDPKDQDSCGGLCMSQHS